MDITQADWPLTNSYLSKQHYNIVLFETVSSMILTVKQGKSWRWLVTQLDEVHGAFNYLWKIDFTLCISSLFLQMRLGWASTRWRTATRCRRPTLRTAASPPPHASSTSSWASATQRSSPLPAPASQPNPIEWLSSTAEAFMLRRQHWPLVWNQPLCSHTSSHTQ